MKLKRCYYNRDIIRMNRLKYHGLLDKDVIYYSEYTPRLTVKNLHFYSLN